MKTVLLASFGSLGDLHPFIGLGLLLKKNGFNVIIATNSSHLERVKSAGFESYGVGFDFSPEDPELIKIVLDPIKGPEILHRKYIFPYTRKLIEDTVPLAKKSDIILTGILGYFVPTLAELTQRPWGSVVLSPMLYWSKYDPPAVPAVPFLRAFRFLGPNFYKCLYKLIFSLSKNWSHELQVERKRLGLDPQINPLDPAILGTGNINIALFSKCFAPPQPDWPANYIQPGFIFYDGPGADAELQPELVNFLKNGSPPILLTLGSTVVQFPGKIYDVFFETLQQSNSRAIILAGKSQLEFYKQKYGTKNIGVFDYAPYGKLMPRCSAVIHQGGIGTTAHTLKAGAPSIVLSSTTDQLDNARMIQHMGAGIDLPLSQLSPRRLTHDLARLQNSLNIKAALGAKEFIQAEKTEEIFIKGIRSIVSKF